MSPDDAARLYLTDPSTDFGGPDVPEAVRNLPVSDLKRLGEGEVMYMDQSGMPEQSI